MSEENTKTSDNTDKYNELLNQLSDSRDKLTQMMTEIDECKGAVLDTAKSNDYRNRYAKEERLKTISTFYGLALSVRQEYTRNIISEIELRRKLEKGDDGDQTVDIVKIAKQLESIKKQQKKIDDVKLFKPIAVTQSK